PAPWHSAPPRPPCLWRHALGRSHCSAASRPVSDTATTCNVRSSDWSSGLCIWRMLHPNTRSFECTDVLRRLHAAGLLGDQEFRRHQSNLSPPSMLPYLLMCPPAVSGPPGPPSYTTLCDGPFGRRSMSSWAHDGNLYVAFGTLRSDALRFKVYFNDVWRFCLEAKQWFPVHYDSEPTSSALGPSARRRATAVLHLPQPCLDRGRELPRVFVYGGTQPQRLNAARNRHRAAVTATCAGDTVPHSNSVGSKELRTVSNPSLTRPLLPLLPTDVATAAASPSLPLDPLAGLVFFVAIGDSSEGGPISSPAFHLFAVTTPTFLSNPLPALFSCGGLLVFTSLTDLLTSPSTLSSDLASGSEATPRDNATVTRLLRALQSSPTSSPPSSSRPPEPSGDRRQSPTLFNLLLCETSTIDGADRVDFSRLPPSEDTATATAVCLRLVGRVAAELARQLPSQEDGNRPPGLADSIRVCLPLEEATLNSQSIPSAAGSASQGGLQCCLRPSFFQVATSDLLTDFVQSLSSVSIQSLASAPATSASSSSLSLPEVGMESEEDDLSIISSSSSSASSSSSNSNSCSSPERLDERCAYVPTVGHVLRGRENLKMLNDVYVLHLEASLYQLCLSRVRGLFLVLPKSSLEDLPDNILHLFFPLVLISFHSPCLSAQSVLPLSHPLTPSLDHFPDLLPPLIVTRFVLSRLQVLGF
ncbi:unnamed protein product, partial [Schistocephalus solidus]|uniref:WD domain, G-beta repeat-containing protein n=1 Tax=Schistocephalus solidus TaxID=70667 RepID=A0A183TCB4_SCHSO